MQYKLKLLKEKLAAYEKLAVAFSGGADSTLLLLCAKEVLGDQTLAVTVAAPNFQPEDAIQADRFCKENEISHLTLNMDESMLEVFRGNPTDRCYKCKLRVFAHMQDCLGDMDLVEGTNFDDISDYRPGIVALKELGVKSPLVEVGMTKGEVRSALKAMNQGVWDRPAYSCLVTRIPYGEEVTKEKLESIGRIEKKLIDMGFRQVRLRHHGEIARIELAKEEIERLLDVEIRQKIDEVVKKEGFTYVTVDLNGYVMGNFNKDV